MQFPLGFGSAEREQPHGSQHRLPLARIAGFAREPERLPLASSEEDVTARQPTLHAGGFAEKGTPSQFMRAHIRYYADTIQKWQILSSAVMGPSAWPPEAHARGR